MADFILRHIPCYREWDSEIFLGWLKWHEGHGFIQRVFDFDDSLVALAICRPIMHPKDADDFYAFDPEGSVIYVETAVITKPGIMHALTLAAIKRFGMREWVAWKRPPFYCTRFHDARKYLRIVSKKYQEATTSHFANEFDK